VSRRWAVSDKTCQHCGKDLPLPLRPHRRFCCTECRLEHYRTRNGRDSGLRPVHHWGAVRKTPFEVRAERKRRLARLDYEESERIHLAIRAEERRRDRMIDRGEDPGPPPEWPEADALGQAGGEAEAQAA